MKTIYKIFEDSIDLRKELIEDVDFLKRIDEISKTLINVLKNGGTIYTCGNGGSASDALHFVGEILGRFQVERRPYKAISLNADIATMTAIANDYGYDEVFARQVEGLITNDDVLFSISTSGNSKNILNAIDAANRKGAQTISLLGKTGGRAVELSKLSLVVNNSSTARIQEIHITIIHILCEIIEGEIK